VDTNSVVRAVVVCYLIGGCLPKPDALPIIVRASVVCYFVVVSAIITDNRDAIITVVRASVVCYFVVI